MPRPVGAGVKFRDFYLPAIEPSRDRVIVSANQFAHLPKCFAFRIEADQLCP